MEQGGLGPSSWSELTPLASSAVSTRWASFSHRSSVSRTETISPSCWLGTRQIWRHSARSGTLPTASNPCPPSQPGRLLWASSSGSSGPAPSVVTLITTWVAPKLDLLRSQCCTSGFPENCWMGPRVPAPTPRSTCPNSAPSPPQ